jgi:hypothetical protein
MQVVLGIIIRVAEIMTIIAGLAGVCLSLGLILSPGLIRKANRTLNRQMMTESQLATLNPSINSESFALRYHHVSGGFFIVGSIFILLFLFVGTQVPEDFGFFTNMVIEFSILLGKTAGVVGLAAGLLLFFYPAAFKALGRKTNISIDTQPVFNKLDTVSVDIDSIIIKFSWIFGLVGLAVSAALIIISVLNFLGTAASLR